MRVILRADAGVTQGTGHVMRCLTLAETLLSRGHEVHLMTAPIAIDWLAGNVERSGVTIDLCNPDELPQDRIRAIGADWLVVDSYRIAASSISAAGVHTRVMAIVDGDDRMIDAALYLDQNLGAEAVVRPAVLAQRFLAGPDFALVRKAVLDERREQPWRIQTDRPKVLCFMGGTDPTGSIVGVARALSGLARNLDLTIIAPERHHTAVREALSVYIGFRLLAPTRSLPALIAEAEIAISAAGTSAWDICTLGIPAVFLAVVDNQQASLRELVSQGLALGLDLVGNHTDIVLELGSVVARLLDDVSLRAQLASKSLAVFDGGGGRRVVERMELMGNQFSRL